MTCEEFDKAVRVGTADCGDFRETPRIFYADDAPTCIEETIRKVRSQVVPTGERMLGFGRLYSVIDLKQIVSLAKQTLCEEITE